MYEFFECSSNIPSGLSCLQTSETKGLLHLRLRAVTKESVFENESHFR